MSKVRFSETPRTIPSSSTPGQSRPLPPRTQPRALPRDQEDTYAPALRPRYAVARSRQVDPTMYPLDTDIKGLMTPTQFMNAVDAYTDQLVAIGNSTDAPPDSTADRIAVTHVAGSTVNGLLLGAPNRFREAFRAPAGSHERHHELVDGGIRGAAAILLAPTFIVPVVSSLVGFVRGQHGVNQRGMRRIYQRELVKRNVLRPFVQLLENEAPMPLGIEHRARVRAFLDVCATDPGVKRVLKRGDTAAIEKWLQDADRI